VAPKTGLLDVERPHQPGHKSRTLFGNGARLACPALEAFQGRPLPIVGSIIRIQSLQACDMRTDSRRILRNLLQLSRESRGFRTHRHLHAIRHSGGARRASRRIPRQPAIDGCRLEYIAVGGGPTLINQVLVVTRSGIIARQSRHRLGMVGQVPPRNDAHGARPPCDRRENPESCRRPSHPTAPVAP
jgi:hypothetical protein